MRSILTITAEIQSTFMIFRLPWPLLQIKKNKKLYYPPHIKYLLHFFAEVLLDFFPNLRYSRLSRTGLSPTINSVQHEFRPMH